MNSKTRVLNRHRPLALCAAGFFCLSGLGRADTIFNIQSVTAAAGSTGDALDVTLTNTYPSAATFYGFSFGLLAGTKFFSFGGLTFTSVTTATTAPYLLAGNSQFAPNIGGGDINTVQANDDVPLLTGSTVAAGATVGLGHVIFNLSADTPAGTIFPISFIPAGDTLCNVHDCAPFLSTATGTVTVTSATPEPATFILVGLTLTGLLGATRHFRRRAK